jgi:hypothetical protein
MNPMPQVFLLSPAFCGGRRAKILVNPKSDFALARQLYDGTLTLGEAFSFLSGLYFRGKLAYARAFGRAPADEVAPAFIITPTRGLRVPESLVSADLLREFASVDVDAGDPRYRRPLERDLAALECDLPADARVVLLGSIATGKYVDVLRTALGSRLRYPSSFVGRGDMSRGGLLLRQANALTELEYVAFDVATRPRGPRPPKLPPIRALRAN